MFQASIPTPTHLVEYTTAAAGKTALYKYEWRGQLQDKQGSTAFKIKYYGKLHEEYPALIVGVGETPALVVAEDPGSGEEIVLFDGCRHGYNAMFCDEYADTDRKPTAYYRDEQGQELFSVEISIYNHHYHDEDELEIDEDGKVTLLNGSRIDVDTARRDAFDVIQIRVTNASGQQTSIMEEELA